METYGRKILVVDDSKSIRRLVAVILNDEKCEIIEAVDGKEALEKIKFHRPRIVILDVIIPKVSGIRVCEQVKRDSKTRDIFIIVITSDSSLEVRERAFAAGADVFMLKPFEPRDLRSAVRRMIREI